MTDVLLYQTNDGGDITVTNGVAALSGGLETCVYLCLFGGNEDDDGSQDSPNNWWGNIGEIDPIRHYRSLTQYLLRSIPFSTGNLLRIKDAVVKDLSGFLSEGVASSVDVRVTIPGLNKIRISVTILNETFNFITVWQAEI